MVLKRKTKTKHKQPTFVKCGFVTYTVRKFWVLYKNLTVTFFCVKCVKM